MVRGKQRVHVDASGIDPVAYVLALHMSAGDDNGAVTGKEAALPGRPAILTHECAEAQLTAMTWAIQGQARRTECALAWLRHREPVLLLPPDARAQIAVHELDDRPVVCELAIDVQAIHVV